MNHDPHLIGAAVLAVIGALVALVILAVTFAYNRSQQRRKS